MPLARVLLPLLVIISLHGPLLAQVSVLSGVAPSYAGDELVFYRYSDMITNTEEPVGRCLVDAQGKFECRLNIDEISYVFIPLGVYKGYLYIELGSNYTLLLPNKEEKTEAQRLNPFFRPTELHIGIEGLGQNDLNFMIWSFNLAFNEHFDQIVTEAFSGEKTIPLDSLFDALEDRFLRFNHPFFDSYRDYRYGLLQQLSLMMRSREISNSYFLNKPILYNNPAYMELFNLLYDKYFLFIGRSVSGSAVYDNISEQRSFTNLKNTLAQDNVLSNDTLLEMVILKGLYDGFFDDRFSRSALLEILDSLYTRSTIAEHIVIAQNIRTKVTRLLPGFTPNPFQLYSSNGELVSFDDFKGRFLYINFCTTSSYTCLQEFILLEKLRERFGEFLDIVTISADRSAQEMKEFVEQSKYPWIFLHYGNNPEIIKDFDIRAYPTYFLIGPDQRLILSPAPSPQENIEVQIFRILRSRGVL